MRSAGSRAGPGTSSRPSSATRTTGSRPTTSRRTPRGSRPPDLAHQPGAAPALDSGGPRPRLHRPCAPCCDGCEDVRHARPAGDAPGPLPQLVRHPDAPAAAPGLRLDRRQRQPARLPDRPEARAAREGRGPALRPGVGVGLRHLGPGHPGSRRSEEEAGGRPRRRWCGRVSRGMVLSRSGRCSARPPRTSSRFASG